MWRLQFWLERFVSWGDKWVNRLETWSEARHYQVSVRTGQEPVWIVTKDRTWWQAPHTTSKRIKGGWASHPPHLTFRVVALQPKTTIYLTYYWHNHRYGTGTPEQAVATWDPYFDLEVGPDPEGGC